MTDDPVREAEIFYLNRDRDHQKYAEEFDLRYEENLNDLSMFQSFLHDLNSEDPEWKLFFEQMHGDQMDKCYAYDNIIILYEAYVNRVTELMI